MFSSVFGTDNIQMANQDHTISFVTFGMFILDEIEWQTPNPPTPKTNLIGGAGTYAVLGARLAVSPSHHLSRTVSWIVDIGSDFPSEVKSTIDAWNTNCVFRHDPHRLTTRAWNGYGANELRAFRYLTPKVRLEVSSLNSSQIMARSFHMVCSPDRCLDITTKLREVRRTLNPTAQDPVIVWEPIPDLCSPEQLSRLQEAARTCTIISPNHDELKMFFPEEISAKESQSQLVMRLAGWNTYNNQATPPPTPSSLNSPSPIVIVREGSNGSTAYIRLPATSASASPQQHQTNSITIHLPAYHKTSMSSQVTDPTGGGNTYLGALALTLGLYSHATNSTAESQLQLPLHTLLSQYLPGKETDKKQGLNEHLSYPGTDINKNGTNEDTILTITYAMIVSLVAASFAIEQHGTPNLNSGHRRKNDDRNEQSSDDQQAGEEGIDGEDEIELWNGETVMDRTRRYLEREGNGIRREMELAIVRIGDGTFDGSRVD